MIAQKVAVIDLGTNTFNLLLVKVTQSAYYIFRNEKIAIKLGKDGINQGIINKKAQERAMNCLNNYKEIIEKEGISQVYCYATSAFRTAKNGQEFKALIEKQTGFQITIISGDTEADFIYNGVKNAIDIGGNPSLIMDIGGGSVEFIICNRDKIFWKKSFNIGAQRLLDWFHNIDPIPANEIEKLDIFLRIKLEQLQKQIEIYKPDCLIGSSGAFDTLSEMHQHEINLYLSGGETELPLTIDGFNKSYERVISRNKKNRLEIPGMQELRVDMIVVAACIVNFIIKNYQIKQIRVSAHSLKEGMISIIQEKIISQNSKSASGN